MQLRTELSSGETIASIRCCLYRLKSSGRRASLKGEIPLGSIAQSFGADRTTLAFRKLVGFFAVGLSTLLSAPFFEPVGSLALLYASDLIKIELYAVLSADCVSLGHLSAHRD